ncbi:unnamed protein product [Prunus brigantina]
MDLISFLNNNCVLGPRYLEMKSDQLCKYEPHPIWASIPICRSDGIDWTNWNNILSRFFLKIDVLSIDFHWVDWADSPLMGSAVMFWNSASNTFDFGVGLMSISILDLDMIFGFQPHGRSANWFGDFQDDPSKDREEKEP